MGALQKRDPFDDIWNLSDEVGRFFWGLGSHTPLEGRKKRSSFVPAIDVSEDKEALHITAELPGLKRENLKIKVRDGVFTLSGDKFEHHEGKEGDYHYRESSSGSFARSFTLPNTVDQDAIKAQMKDGVLKVMIPKKPEAKEKEIDVSVD